MPYDQLRNRVEGHLDEIDRRGERRVLRPPAGIDLSSNDYLGLSCHPFVKARMAEAVRREGCGSTGSRLLRGERECFNRVEQRFAEFKAAPRSLYFSSGYMANLGVFTTFVEETDVVFSDERNHASLIDGIRLARARRVIFPHADVDTLARRLREDTGGGQRFLVTESLFSMDGDHAPLREYAALCRANGVALIVDEAHAVGTCGPRGSGLIGATGIERDVFLSIDTAGKALGVSGAFVSGPPWAIEYLVQRARSFVFSTAPPPAVAAALEASLTIIADEPHRRTELGARAAYLRDRLAQAGIAVPRGSSHIIPVVIGDADACVTVAAALQHAGFDVRAIRPPTVPRGGSRLRLSINVNLTETVLDRFAATLAATLARLGTCSAVSS